MKTVRKGRLALALVVAGLWFAGVGLRLADLQVRRHEHFAERAERQQQKDDELRSPRGTIYDARGRPLAVSLPVDTAYAEMRSITDPRTTAAGVAAAVPGVDAGELATRLAGQRGWVLVARKLDAPVSRALAASRVPGIVLSEDTKRYYPNRELAAALLGYVGTEDRGLAGLEERYEGVVAGRPVRRTLLTDARHGTAAPPELPFVEARPGSDVQLTLDAAIQHVVERELARAVADHGALSGSAVVLDPHTGAVLAMASVPGFDPNRFNDVGPELRRNRVVQDAYEPGSTFKIFTAAAALGANVLDPSDVIDCEMGATRVNGHRIRDHKPFGLLTFRQVIAKSSNVGAIHVGLAAGGDRLADTIAAFGFGRATGIDLPGENRGRVPRLRARDRLPTAYVSFGQGMSVTPLQLAVAFAAVANGGDLLRPYVVEKVDGVAPEPRPQVVGRPVAAATVRELERMMEGVVTPEGTGKAAMLPGYRVAGKTGTAQVAAEDGGGYSETRFVASFAGFAPARDPVLVAVVAIDGPRLPIYHGGEVAAPVFRAIAERVLAYLEVRPNAPEEPPWEVAAARGLARRETG